jgi:hypothetical protein
MSRFFSTFNRDEEFDSKHEKQDHHYVFHAFLYLIQWKISHNSILHKIIIIIILVFDDFLHSVIKIAKSYSSFGWYLISIW